jgi:hydroxyacylglutathione hydrolase
MIIERIWAANPGRNFHYLVGCEDSGEALAVDPLNWQACLERARALGLTITQILNTHEHLDHTGGNAELKAATGAVILAHADAAARIGDVSRGLHAGDLIRVGRSVQLQCLDTPGHTRAHICAYVDGDAPALFSGDTLFNAGVGNCVHGGDPNLLYDSFAGCLAQLPLSTRVFPGHEYLARNLGFTLELEPGNGAARELLARCAERRAEDMPVTTLGEERQINAFFRLSQPEIISAVQKRRPELAGHSDARSVFLGLRALRNQW